MALKITTVTQDKLPVVRLKGELDMAQGGKLQGHVREMLASGRGKFVLSMVALDYLDSSGLGALVAIAKLLRTKNGRVVLVTNDFVDEILAITRLDDIFDTAETEQHAVDRLNSS